MNNLIVNIEGTNIDLYSDTLIAKTLQCFDLLNLGAIKANYTNQIAVPRTDLNRRTFGFADNSKSYTRIPYRALSCIVTQNGFELISNGVAIVKQTDIDFQIVFYDGNYNFFSIINTLTLQDIQQLEQFGVNWFDATNIATATSATSGIVHAISDLCMMDYVSSQYNVYKIDSHPWIYYKDLINTIFTQFGFTLSGTIMSDKYFTKMVVPLALQMNKKFCKFFEFTAKAAGGQNFVMNSIGSTVKIQFTDIVVSNPGLDGTNCYNGTDTYTVRSNQSVESLYLNFGVDVNLTVTGSGSFSVGLYRNGVGPVAISSASTSPQTNQQMAAKSTAGEISTSIELGSNQTFVTKGDVVDVRVVQNSGGPMTFTINKAAFYSKIPYPSLKRNWVTVAHPQYMFQDLKLVDLMKELSLQFGLMFNQIKGTVYARRVNEIIADVANAQDWTAKRDNSIPDTITFQSTNFAQTNIINWSNSADNTLDQNFLNEQFTIQDISLPTSQTKTSMFSSSDMVGLYTTDATNNRGIFYCVKTKAKTVTGDTYVKDIGLRVALVRDSDSKEVNALVIRDGVGGTPRSVSNPYKVAYFYDSIQTINLSMAELFNYSYSSLISALQNTKIIVRNYNLTDKDIAAFDPLKLVHDNGENFIVNKINTFVPGQLTQVELFKV